MRAKYRLYCETESLWKYTDWLDNPPTECPDNAGHAIIVNSIVIIDTIESIFGTEYNFAVSDVESTTTATDWQEKTEMSLTDLPEGNYRIEWSFEWSYSFQESAGANFGVHINWGAITIMETEMAVPKNGTYGKGCYYHQGGFGYVNLTAGDHKIAINYHAVGGKIAYIRKARLEIWRES